jgi:hypothetical protein
MNSLKPIIASLLCLSSYSLNGMHTICFSEHQATVVRHEKTYKERLTKIKLETESNTIFKKNITQQEYKSMVRNSERNFHMCIAGHFANN